jgi:hypothetical protein
MPMMSPWVVTVLLATAQPGVADLYRSGVDSIQECQSFGDPNGIFAGKDNFNRKILMMRCDRLHKFMVCASHRRLDCIPQDVAAGDEHWWTVRYHPLPKPSSDVALDGIIETGAP